MAPTFLTSRQLAKRWCLTTATLRQWRWFEKGPHYRKVGTGHVLYDLKDIEEFEEKALRYHTTMAEYNPLKLP